MSQTIAASQFLATQFPRPKGAPLKNEEQIGDFLDKVLDQTALTYRPPSNTLSLKEPEPIHSSEQAVRLLRQGIEISERSQRFTLAYDREREALTSASARSQIAPGTVIDLSA